MKKLLLLLLLSSTGFLYAQDIPKALQLKEASKIVTPDQPKPSLFKRWNAKANDFLHDETPNPTKAVLMSMALPGLGQVYNGKDWKVPIVYAGLGTTLYLINRNTKFYKRFQTAYLQRLNDEPDEFLNVLSSATEIKRLRDDSRKTMEQAWFAFGFIYLLNGVDAFVDAHLFTFNVDDDLSLQVAPHFDVNSENRLSAGIGLSMRF